MKLGHGSVFHLNDRTQERIRLEAEAVLSILDRCRSGEWTLLGSEAIESEISKTPDQTRKQKVLLLANLAKSKIVVTDVIRDRTRLLIESGFKAYDALHLACAEAGNADAFLTTDDRLLRKAQRDRSLIQVRAENPVVWLMEMIQHEH